MANADRVSVKALAAEWLADERIDESLKQAIRQLQELSDPNVLRDHFYKDLSFGTSGMRGVRGPGTNRMNVCTVALATQGMAQALQEGMLGSGTYRAVIAYDSRYGSREFAVAAARVLAGNGIQTRVYREPRTTPQLSHAIRHYDADVGIVLTASHNPPEYGGYKAYGPDGAQFLPEQADQIVAAMQALPGLSAVRQLSEAEAVSEGLLVWLGDGDDEPFLSAVLQAVGGGGAASTSSRAVSGGGVAASSASASGGEDVVDVKSSTAVPAPIVFTPLHGAAGSTVMKALELAGIEGVIPVAEQLQPDGDFPTVPRPNPEEQQAFELSVKLGREVGAGLLLAVDPDGDRLGAQVFDIVADDYQMLSGNEIGAVLLDELLTRRSERGDERPAALVQTIVSGALPKRLGEAHGLQVHMTLTGFKYIAGRIRDFEASQEPVYLFGYEESYGYLAGTYCRDKDAVGAALLLIQAMQRQERSGQTLLNRLNELYTRYGWQREIQQSYTAAGETGAAKIAALMEAWRAEAKSPGERLGALPGSIVEAKDYQDGIDALPIENVLKFFFANGDWFCLRPSGTEPKLKLYLSAGGETKADTTQRLEQLRTSISRLIESDLA